MQRIARSHLAWPARGLLPVPSSAGATSSQLRRLRPCAPASSEDHVSHTVVRLGAICHFLTAGMEPWHINASVHAVLRPVVLRVGQSGSHRSPAAMTAATPASRLRTAGVLRNCRRRAPRVQPGPRCRAIRSLRWGPGTATRHRLPPACSPPRRPRSRARRARRGRLRCCRCGSGT